MNRILLIQFLRLTIIVLKKKYLAFMCNETENEVVKFKILLLRTGVFSPLTFIRRGNNKINVLKLI